MNKLHKEAVNLIETIVERRQKYEKINDQIRELQGDFPTHLNFIDTDCEAKTVELLDKVLGDEELASYFIYECQNRKEGGYIQINEDGKKYPLKTIKDLEKYIKEQL